MGYGPFCPFVARLSFPRASQGEVPNVPQMSHSLVGFVGFGGFMQGFHEPFEPFMSRFFFMEI